MLAIFLACAAGFQLTSHRVNAEERRFLVNLANSPKQYPGPYRDPAGLQPAARRPTGGLVPRHVIEQQYFDTVDSLCREPPTGKPDAGEPLVRFGARGNRVSNRSFLPLLQLR